ncbi:hypothetical protein CLTEP_12150 [Clostridium tepidiprofundi DSM 19306]|uniref:2'-5' RNA ligase n=1 Tax=Clostridium tepidiprofundi DSM 19306 TaxID=1121338 RepID=A0A151B516_9CLOT|nr:hypothetical protein [Clostridium tepidiprofundi]KYH34893.1 hypothetical protein CLTEP_12150 [Clostridium tepidiprofundi DSM 19306]
MKFELVALFDKNTCAGIEELQRNICRKYKIHKSTHPLYIPLGTIFNPDINKLNNIITKVLEPYKKFKVGINNSLTLNNQGKLVNIMIDNRGYIIRIQRNIEDTLSLHGFNINNKNNTINIPLALANYNIKKAYNDSGIPVYKYLPKTDHLKFAKIDRLELWRLNGNHRDAIVKSFPLREY